MSKDEAANDLKQLVTKVFIPGAFGAIFGWSKANVLNSTNALPHIVRYGMNGCIIGGIYFGSLGAVRMMLKRDDAITWGVSGGITGLCLGALYRGKLKSPLFALGLCGINVALYYSKPLLYKYKEIKRKEYIIEQLRLNIQHYENKQNNDENVTTAIHYRSNNHYFNPIDESLLPLAKQKVEEYDKNHKEKPQWDFPSWFPIHRFKSGELQLSQEDKDKIDSIYSGFKKEVKSPEELLKGVGITEEEAQAMIKEIEKEKQSNDVNKK